MAVPIQDAVFFEVNRDEVVLAGFLDNETLPHGPYRAFFTAEPLVGQSGDRLLRGCAQLLADGSKLSRQQMFAKYGL